MSGPHENDRDLELGTALLELEVPSLPDDFYEELRRRLDETAVGPPRPARRWVAAGVVAAAAAAAVLLLVAPERAPLSPRPVLAAELKQKLRLAFRSPGALVASVTATQADPATGRRAGPPVRGRLLITPSGSYRYAELRRGSSDAVAGVSGFDARRGVLRAFTAEPPGSPTGEVWTGMAPGPPDQFEPPIWPQLGAVVRALLDERDPLVQQETFAGRPVWRANVALTPYRRGNPGQLDPRLSPDRLEALIDRRTGLPVLVVERRRELTISRTRLSWRRLRRSPERLLEVGFPEGTRVRRHEDLGFRRARLNRVRATLGYRPLIPRWLPEGYELADVAVARRAMPTAQGLNPVSRRVLSLTYRRGSEHLTVTTRLRGDARWRDPFGSSWYASRAQRRRLASGALAHAPAQVVLDTRQTPHLWALGRRLVLTVAGDATARELVRVAESLEAR